MRGLADWVKGLVVREKLLLAFFFFIDNTIKGTEQRWLPYNGAFGDAQLAFLRSELQGSLVFATQLFIDFSI